MCRHFYFILVDIQSPTGDIFVDNLGFFPMLFLVTEEIKLLLYKRDSLHLISDLSIGYQCTSRPYEYEYSYETTNC